MDKAADLYHRQMVEALARFNAIDHVLNASASSTVGIDFDNEFMWLQIRKIVELVTFGGITSDEERYAALRAETTNNPDYTQDWKVNAILPRLAKITPHYLPIPISSAALMDSGLYSYDEIAGLRTVERFKEIYNMAGEYLHVSNPFSPVRAAQFQQSLLQSRALLVKELAYLKRILWRHIRIGLAFDKGVDLPTAAGDPQRAWVVEFDKPFPGDVHMILAVSTPPPAPGADGPTGATDPASSAGERPTHWEK